MNFAWVIERDTSDGSAPEYWTGLDWLGLDWSSPGDHAAAVRFAREQDGIRVRDGVFGASEHRVCEHGWDDGQHDAVGDPERTREHCGKPMTLLTSRGKPYWLWCGECRLLVELSRVPSPVAVAAAAAADANWTTCCPRCAGAGKHLGTHGELAPCAPCNGTGRMRVSPPPGDSPDRPEPREPNDRPPIVGG